MQFTQFVPQTVSRPHRSAQRIRFLDEWRGIVILMMIAYHAAYDLVFIVGIPLPWDAIERIQPWIAWSFILLAGISCRFSHSNVRRGLQTILLGCVISTVTWCFIPEEMIWFGILHFLGTSMLLFACLQPLLDRCKPIIGGCISLLLFFCTLQVPRGKLGLPWLDGIALPHITNKWWMPLGFGGAGSDYFPLIPFFFLFLVGVYSGIIFTRTKLPAFFYCTHPSWLARIGQHSLLIYMLHQPLIYGVLLLIF